MHEAMAAPGISKKGGKASRVTWQYGEQAAKGSVEKKRLITT